MVIDDFHLMGVSSGPNKANTPLIIDAYAVLPGALPAKRFQPVGRRYPQVIEIPGIVDHAKFAPCYVLYVLR